MGNTIIVLISSLIISFIVGVKYIQKLCRKKLSEPVNEYHKNNTVYLERKTILYKRDVRRRKKNKIWTILQFISSYSELMKCTNFYQFKNANAKFSQSIGRMKKEDIRMSDINIAIRFCQMEHYYGICEHELSPHETEQLFQWRNLVIDNNSLLKCVLLSYEEYWDGVLNSYVRLSAKKNRLKYLINDLEEIMALPEIQTYSDIIGNLKMLQEKYSSQLNVL